MDIPIEEKIRVEGTKKVRQRKEHPHAGLDSAEPSFQKCLRLIEEVPELKKFRDNPKIGGNCAAAVVRMALWHTIATTQKGIRVVFEDDDTLKVILPEPKNTAPTAPAATAPATPAAGAPVAPAAPAAPAATPAGAPTGPAIKPAQQTPMQKHK